MSDCWLIQWMLKIVDLVAALVHYKTDLCGKQDMFGPENWGKVAASPVFTASPHITLQSSPNKCGV